MPTYRIDSDNGLAVYPNKDAAIQETGLYVHDISNLAKGDLLVTDASAGGEVIVTVNGKPRFAGQLGQYNGHRAVTITRKLD